MERIKQRIVGCLASVSLCFMLTSCAADYQIKLLVLARCSGRVEVFYDNIWKALCDENWGALDAVVACRQLGCGSPLNTSNWNESGPRKDQISLSLGCSGQEGSLEECPNHNRTGVRNCSNTKEAVVTCSDLLLLHVLTAAGGALLLLLVLLVTCAVVWTRRRAKRCRVIIQSQLAVVEDQDYDDDYEKVDDEKMEEACRVNQETDDDDYEGSLRGEPFVRASSEDEEEADYINLTSEQNVQVVDIFGDNESDDYENVAKEEQLVYIYDETNFIYQNMGSE